VTTEHRTRVGIVGAGPAGLLLGHLLHRHGVESVVLEARSRHYVEHRIRAGVLEHGTVELLKEAGVGERLEREGMEHGGIELRFDRRGHRIDFPRLTGGRTITVYGQTEVVKDLIAARLDAGLPLLFEVEDVSVHDLEGEPRIRYRHEGSEHELRCDVIAGCDGFHGICRPSIPDGALAKHEREYPFAWLGILAEVPPSTEELIYARHERGFALHSMRTPQLSRFYLQCAPDDDPDDWSDERIWEELEIRLERDGFTLNTGGPIVEKGVTPMRSFVVDPMQHGNLYLAGDAAHIVPPTGAKGLNLAVGDVRELAQAPGDDDRAALASYSERCLRRVWRAEHFSWWMTSMLHRFPGEDADFEEHLQRAQLDYVCHSEAAATTLAENYVGFRWEKTNSLF
jgi:p-hydroxybenzoate 3-monooxygenase